MNIFAHRGISARFPENTITAFKKAFEKACYGIELDVQLTRDGEVVIVHDENLLRTTARDILVKDIDYPQLAKLNANRTRPETAEEHVPSLAEYCRWAQDKEFITNIELKTSRVYYPGLVQKTLAVVEAYQMQDKVIYSSFNPLSLVQLKELNKSYPCGLLVEEQIVNAGQLCRDMGLEYYHPCLRDLTRDIVDECHQNGIGVNVWTINTREELELARTLGVDAVFCNDISFS